MQRGLSRRLARVPKGYRPWVVGGLLLAVGAAVQADPIFSAKYNEEVQERSSGTPQFSVSQAQPVSGFRTGYQTSFLPTTGGIATLYYFQLPALPSGQAVSTATFSVSELKESAGTAVTPTFNVDLYGAGYDTSGNPFATDDPSTGYGSGGVASTSTAQTYFYTGANQTGATGANGLAITKLTEDLFTPTDWTAAKTAGNVAKTTDASVGSALANYIQGIYDNPSFDSGGGYLILRLTPDASAALTGTQRYQFPFAVGTAPIGKTDPDYSAYGTITEAQVNLTFAAVPEPASIGLIGFAAVGLLARRKR